MILTMKQLIVIIYIFLILQYTGGDTENDTFVATNDWQEIKEGQKIPAGLHIRLNLQTGRKQAKLLSPDSTDTHTSDSALADYNNEVANNFHTEPLSIEYSTKPVAQIRKTYKDYKKLKKEFESMKLNFKTDSELIIGLIKEYNKTILNKDSSVAVQLEILENLNYLVHQIDNALWFINSGGLDYIILPMIVNQTNRDFRIQSLRILGTLTQNNPIAQIKVYKKNFGIYLSNILLQSQDKNELSAALYAFGSLLRKFPLCQREILSKSGTKALISVLSKDTEIKIKLKVLLLISDLLTDKEQTLNALDVDAKKLIQYSAIFFEDWLNQNDYCKIIEEFLDSTKNEIILQANILEECTESLDEQKFCHDKWAQSVIIKKSFQFISDNLNSNDDDYHNEVIQKFKKFYYKIFKVQNNIKNEL